MGQTLEAAIRMVPAESMQRVVDEALVVIDPADGAVIELVDDDTLTYAWASGALAGSAGLQLRRANSLSGLAIATKSILRCDDTATDPRVDTVACERLNIGSMICVPLHRGLDAVGVLKVSARQANVFDDDDITLLKQLADFVTTIAITSADVARSAANLLDEEMTESGREHAVGFLANVFDRALAVNVAANERIRRVIDGHDVIEFVYQPVLDLSSGQLVGVEALARFHTTPQRGPDEWFAEAHAVGLGVDLELMAIELALQPAHQLPDTAYLALNVGPETLADPHLVDITRPLAPRLVIELTEHTQANDTAVSDTINTLRDAGARLAVDDTGAGYSGLTRILQLQPDIIKLDRQLTIGIETDTARLALAESLVRFSTHTGASLTAEGIENAAALNTLISAGVPYGQGYHLARPMPLCSLASFIRTHPPGRLQAPSRQ